MDTDKISCDTYFNKIYTYTLRDVDALNESPVPYLEKKLNSPIFASTLHRQFYDVIIL